MARIVFIIVEVNKELRNYNYLNPRPYEKVLLCIVFIGFFANGRVIYLKSKVVEVVASVFAVAKILDLSFYTV